MSKLPRLGILGSGAGSNCQSILDAIDEGSLVAEVALVLSDNPDAFILERAKQRGIPAYAIDCRGFKQKFPIESQESVVHQLQDLDVDLVCLAGFMRLIGQPLLSAYPNRILNIHPSLLPLFPGLHAWEQAIQAKATQSGCTVHYVDLGMDTGSIIEQACVPAYEDDTPTSLHARIQEQEHIIYPSAIRKVLKKLGVAS
ncbi:MAG: phosphoribosylglycinamide formyltransferase [Akkermansia sp.]